MTYSIIAREPTTGAFGIAVASRFFAVGSVVPYIKPSAAFASQAFVNPMWGVEGVQRLNAGESGLSVLTDFVQRDKGQSIRQAHLIDAHGQCAAHTGAQCVDWAGHVSSTDVSVAGNMLAGPTVISATLECYQDNRTLEFPERLLAAMDAGELAGGDKRGKQSAALRIHQSQDYPALDLRVDDHADPLQELRRLYSVGQERLIHFVPLFATSTNFSGTTDRTQVDRAIAEQEAQQQRDGFVSRSFATTN